VQAATPVLAGILLAGLLLAGCRQGDSEDCRAVANHYAAMVEHSVAKSGEAKLVEETQAHLPPLKDAVERACDSKNWPRGTRRCVLAAQSIEALHDCDPGAELKAGSSASAGPDGQKGPDQ